MPLHRVRVPMRWGDMDAYQHVNNVAFLGYLEEARIDLLFRVGADAGVAALREGLVVARHEIDYLAPLVWHPRGIDVEVGVATVGGGSFEVAYRVHDDATTYARARSTLVAYDLAAGRPRRLSPAERAFVEAHRTEPETP
ncbi:acyl-CoA thioester hydrolase [Motilibacter rhizosphaerae]|uniref:Acyl-CoA thioester hydrolase n=1 Tax=Motilibacter rhizosphaerae TaxID=598652 RepID=A0A4Q7NTU7_9ACTN|nr:thioesterase family protein [Motilibacter rhizosphaerae]RZS89832.1 acyl-CoA thioester hydrolase [Motilibacter rhizosphaerae]